MAAENPQILTPSKVAAGLKRLMDREFGRVAVAGELAGVARAPSGHAYFTLKDAGATLSSVIWKSSRRVGMEALLENGLEVLAWGKLACYGPRSQYQLVCDRLEPRGEGALKRAYELLKKRLEAQGIFRSERKRPLPRFPGKVALLTSGRGAAVEDFAKTALSRYPGAAISLFPVRVQGEGAALEMASAIAAVNSWGGFDLIVLTRGGGSAEDLWAFSEEPLVLAVAASRLPVLAAVGHSRDLSLCELAADASAITPTAAAEAVFPDASAAAGEALEMAARMRRSLESSLAGHRASLEHSGRSGALFMERRIAQGRQALARLREALAGSARLVFIGAAAQSAALSSKLAHSASVAVGLARAEATRLDSQLKILSPANKALALRSELDGRVNALGLLKERLLAPFRND
ncbi:MAG: exodeoxyribonuclease VII large subunit, partial [Deltaproteobacteria bacterium]|nr:exodeoxyribonuclease VII large subunit [Deltaproteobacteria bacterium]